MSDSTFILSKLVWYLADPQFLLIAALALGLVAWAIGRRWGRRLVIAAVLVTIVVAWLPFPRWLVQHLEDRFPPPQLPAQIAGIVIQGGGLDAKRTQGRGQPAFQSAERFTVARTLAAAHPEARVIFSGAAGSLVAQEFPEAPLAQALLSDWGVARVEIEDQARTTRENAVLTKVLADPRPGETWVLVTSAWHLPRSVAAFRGAGIDVIGYPAGYETEPEEPFTIRLEWARGMRLLSIAAKEWLGLVAYRIVGYSNELFPAPDSQRT